MKLELSPEELQVLRRELDHHLGCMRAELEQTDAWERRQALNDLTALRRKLDSEREQAVSALNADTPWAPPLVL